MAEARSLSRRCSRWKRARRRAGGGRPPARYEDEAARARASQREKTASCSVRSGPWRRTPRWLCKRRCSEIVRPDPKAE